jgi:DNA-binding response OmpR family regulator
MERLRMLSGLRVLVVEDEPIIAADLAEIVSEGGAHVVGPCSSIAEARQLARDQHVDAAILDVNLKDGDLTPVLEALLARGVPVLVYTGGDLPQKLRERHPDLIVLQKPLQPGRLLLELKRVRLHGAKAAV